MLIAIPSETPGGLDAAVSEHFGHCGAFTLIEIDDGEISEVSVLENAGHEQGGCLTPVNLLKEQGVDVLLTGGMGMRPLAGFQQVGITVYLQKDAASVDEAVKAYLSGDCRVLGEDETCGGGGGCGHHHHEPVVREPIAGPADVRDDRVVTFAYVLKDSEGNTLDTSERGGSMRYLHGAGQLLPALEKAVNGLEPGADAVVEVPSAEAFGARDESRVIEVRRDQVPPEAEVGSTVTAEDENGRHFPLVVVHLDEDNARLDGNHPFAGLDVVFEITIETVESATPEEIAHRHVH